MTKMVIRNFVDENTKNFRNKEISFLTHFYLDSLRAVYVVLLLNAMLIKTLGFLHK